MTDSKLKRWAPTLAGLAFAAVGLGAAGFASSELSLSISPPVDPSQEEIDPVDLLRDEVATLQGDVQKLGEGLGTNLEQLAGYLDGGAQERDARQTERLTKQLTQLSRRLEQLEAQQARLLERPVAASSPRDADTTLEASGAGATQAPTEQPEAVAQVEPEPEAEPAPEPRRGLFTVKLASGLDFSQRLRFKVIPSLSRVGFDGKSTLHDFSGVTSEVEGTLVSRLADPAEGSQAEIRAKAGTLRTGVEGRDENMWGLLEVETHPDVIFRLTGIADAVVDAEQHTVSGLATGTFEIRGVEREVKVPVKLEVDRSRRLVVEGEVQVKLTDFEIDPPSVAGAINMDDTIKLWLSLRMRSLGGAGEDN